MSFDAHAGNRLEPTIVSPESMLGTIRRMGLLPLSSGFIPGWSVEELTPREYWFEGDELGPWDWKIYAVQSGEVAYGKFLRGGKAAFATVEVFRELMNWRRALAQCRTQKQLQPILDFLRENGSIGIREVRQLMGVRKGPADAMIAKLQLQTRVVTGDIVRVYRGEDLHYNGWQTSAFCTPEALFGEEEMRTCRIPAQSYAFLKETIRIAAPWATEEEIERALSVPQKPLKRKCKRK